MDRTHRRQRRHYTTIHRAVMIQAYYDILNECDDFRAVFQGLLREIIPPGTPLRLLRYFDSAPGAVQDSCRQFAYRWHLPTAGGASDVWNSIVIALDMARNAILEEARQQGERAIEVPGHIGGRAATALRLIHAADVGPDFPERMITPSTPDPFRYDPSTWNRGMLEQHADRLAAEVRRSIMEQASEIEREADRLGWAPLPARYRGRQDRMVTARRCYWRWVCGWSWERIACEDSISKASAAGSVKRWEAVFQRS